MEDFINNENDLNFRNFDEQIDNFHEDHNNNNIIDPFQDLKNLTILQYAKKHNINLLTKKPILIPDTVEYQWAEDNWLTQNKIHWIYDEISMLDDQKEWNSEMDNDSKKILTKLFFFFTQIEVEVNQMYLQYTNIFQPFEIKKMVLKYGEVETMHVAGYKYLMVNIFGDKTNDMLNDFMKHKIMSDKYAALQEYTNHSVYDLLCTIVMFGAFSEGVLLYASFAIFLFFPSVKKVLKGTGQILSWSMRDESLHVHSMSQLYKALIQELPSGVHEKLSELIYKKADEIIKLEHEFIDWIFEDVAIPGLNANQLKDYILFKANSRLQQFGFEAQYHVVENPLHWMESVGNVEFTNFFENTVTEYNRVEIKKSINTQDILAMFE